MKAQKAVIRNKYSPALSSKVGSYNVQFPCRLYLIATSSSSSADDNGSSCSCEIRGKEKEQEDTQQGSHFGPSDQTRFGIWSVRSDLTMDGQNLDGRNQTIVTRTNFGRSGSHQGKQRELLLKKIHKLGVPQSKIIKIFFGFLGFGI
jgi:hypothetical protein